MKKRIFFLILVIVIFIISSVIYFSHQQKMKVIYYIQESMELLEVEGYQSNNTISYTLNEGTIFLFLDDQFVLISFEPENLLDILKKCRLNLEDDDLKKLYSNEIIEKDGFNYVKISDSISIWS